MSEAQKAFEEWNKEPMASFEGMQWTYTDAMRAAWHAAWKARGELDAKIFDDAWRQFERWIYECCTKGI